MAETTIIKELIPHIDKTYRTVASRDGRALQGMSMAASARCGWRSVSDLFSSCCVRRRLSWPEELDVNPHPATPKCFNSDKEISRDPSRDVGARNVDKIRGKLTIQIYVGRQDRGWRAIAACTRF